MDKQKVVLQKTFWVALWRLGFHVSLRAWFILQRTLTLEIQQKPTKSFKVLGLVRSNKSEDAKKKTNKPDWYLPKIGGKYDEGILAFKSYGEACKTSPVIKPLWNDVLLSLELLWLKLKS